MKPKRSNIQIGGLLSCLLIFMIAGIPVDASESGNHKTVRLAVTSDLHGWMSTGLMYPTHKRKGLLHLMDGIRRLRLEVPDLILLDGGDLLDGSPLVDFYHQAYNNPAEADIFFQLVQQAGYDAVAVGNHDLGINPLFEKSYLPASGFSWLAANLNRKADWNVKPYILLNRFGLKIAVLGFTTPGARMWLGKRQLGDIRFAAIKRSAAIWLQKVKKRCDPDLVIGLFHSGLYPLRDDENSKLNRISPANAVIGTLNHVEGFDLVISGHDHHLFPYNNEMPVRYIRGTPVIEGGRWGEAFLDLKLNISRRGEKWRISGIKCRVMRASSDERIDVLYRTRLPVEYLDYLQAPLPYTWTRTNRRNARNCLNQINALAQDEPDLDGSLLPGASVSGLSRRSGKQLRRLELYKIFRYDNRTVTVLLSKREIALLGSPEPESGRRRVSGNRILYGQLKTEMNTYEKDAWWLPSEWFEPVYHIKISDYHYHGGAGIVPALFLSAERAVHRSKSTIRGRVFEYLSRGPSLPRECRFLRPVTAR